MPSRYRPSALRFDVAGEMSTNMARMEYPWDLSSRIFRSVDSGPFIVPSSITFIWESRARALRSARMSPASSCTRKQDSIGVRPLTCGIRPRCAIISLMSSLLRVSHSSGSNPPNLSAKSSETRMELLPAPPNSPDMSARDPRSTPEARERMSETIRSCSLCLPGSYRTRPFPSVAEYARLVSYPAYRRMMSRMYSLRVVLS